MSQIKDPDELANLWNKTKVFLILSYILFGSFMLTIFSPILVNRVEPQLSFRYWPIAGPVYTAFLITWLIYVIIISYTLIKEYKKAKGLKKSQIKYVMIGGLLGFWGGTTNYFLWYKIPIPPYGNILA